VLQPIPAGYVSLPMAQKLRKDSTKSPKFRLAPRPKDL
jgi:hypothetical protein